MEDIVIREAREADVARILELYHEAGIEAEPGFTLEEAREQLALFLRYPSLRVFVAELQGEIVATYELLIMDNLAKRGRRSGVVEDVAVSPRLQGQGIGRAMMRHAQEQNHRSYRRHRYLLYGSREPEQRRRDLPAPPTLKV